MSQPPFARLLQPSGRPPRRRKPSARFVPGAEGLEGRALLSRTLEVCHDDPNDYQSVQAAVVAARPGDKIVVCPGTYTESVQIPATKSDLDIESQSPYKAVVNSFDVQGARGITIGGFTVVGPNPTGAYPGFAGIEVEDGSAVTIRKNHVTDRFDQTGIGVVDETAGATTTATIDSNTVDNYLGQNSGSPTAGIVVLGSGASATVTHNTVTGNGPITSVAQNGIEIGFGATARVDHNTVSNNIYAPGSYAATGIYVIDAGSVQLDHNTLTSNDDGVLTQTDDGSVLTGLVIDHNTISRSTYNGIALFDTSGAQVTHNDASNNGMDGLYVDATSVQNTISHNRFRNNGLYDIEDQSHGDGTAGTANQYDHNDCMTSSPPGLCQNQKGGNKSGNDEGDNG